MDTGGLSVKHMKKCPRGDMKGDPALKICSYCNGGP